ncbi:MAG: hypothetical protein AB4042_08725 [Leptolyngbyaceae cyanobacterium]
MASLKTMKPPGSVFLMEMKSWCFYPKRLLSSGSNRLSSGSNKLSNRQNRNANSGKPF